MKLLIFFVGFFVVSSTAFEVDLCGAAGCPRGESCEGGQCVPGPTAFYKSQSESKQRKPNPQGCPFWCPPRTHCDGHYKCIPNDEIRPKFIAGNNYCNYSYCHKGYHCVDEKCVPLPTVPIDDTHLFTPNDYPECKKDDDCVGWFECKNGKCKVKPCPSLTC